MHPLMNNTKWDEIWSLPYNAPGPIFWRVKYLNSDEITPWSDDWHKSESLFHLWKEIEWMEIRFENNKKEIIEDLMKVHVPGYYDDFSAKIIGYSSSFESIDYIR